MENNSQTAVMTIVKPSMSDIITLEPCIFLLFAEYMGYVSKFIDWAEYDCSHPSIEEFKTNILRTEAHFFLNEMKKEYETEEIKKWFYTFKPLVINQWQQTYNCSHKINLHL